MESFPAFIPLAGVRVVIVGDCEAAVAKARLFSGTPAAVVRAMRPHEALEPETYTGARLAFVACDDPAFAATAAAVARAAGCLVNVVDQPHMSDFITPAIIDRDPVTAAIGTGGAAPVLATLLRGEIEARWPRGLGNVAELSRALQAEVREALPDLAERRAFWRGLLRGPAAQAALAGDLDEARRLARAQLAARAPAQGRVWLLEAPDDPARLTLAAVQALGAADRIVAGPQVAAQVLDYARRDAERLAAASPQALTAWAAAGEAVLYIHAHGETVPDIEGRVERLPTG